MTNYPFMLNAGQRKQQFIPLQWNQWGKNNFASWTFEMKEDYINLWDGTLHLETSSTVVILKSERPSSQHLPGKTYASLWIRCSLGQCRGLGSYLMQPSAEWQSRDVLWEKDEQQFPSSNPSWSHLFDVTSHVSYLIAYFLHGIKLLMLQACWLW